MLPYGCAGVRQVSYVVLVLSLVLFRRRVQMVSRETKQLYWNYSLSVVVRLPTRLCEWSLRNHTRAGPMVSNSSLASKWLASQRKPNLIRVMCLVEVRYGRRFT